MKEKESDEQAEHIEDMVLRCQELVDAEKRDEAIDLLLTIYVGGAMKRRLVRGGVPYPATLAGLDCALRERGDCEEYPGCTLPNGHNPELDHSGDTPPQWALDKMWSHLVTKKEKADEGQEVRDRGGRVRGAGGEAGVRDEASERGDGAGGEGEGPGGGASDRRDEARDGGGVEGVRDAQQEAGGPELLSGDSDRRVHAGVVALKGGWRAEAALNDPQRVWEVLQTQQDATGEVVSILCEVYPTGSAANGGMDRSAEDNAKLVVVLLNKHAEEGPEPVEHNHFTTIMPFVHDCPACNPKRVGVTT